MIFYGKKMLRKVGKKKERKKKQKFDESKDFHCNYKVEMVEMLNIFSIVTYSYQQIFCTVLSRVSPKIVCLKTLACTYK